MTLSDQEILAKIRERLASTGSALDAIDRGAESHGRAELVAIEREILGLLATVSDGTCLRFPLLGTWRDRGDIRLASEWTAYESLPAGTLHQGPVEPPPLAEVVLKESTVVTIDGARVGCSSMWERDYELEDGKSVHGMTARISLLATEEKINVGIGSVLAIEGDRWIVRAIAKTAGQKGTVALARL